MTYKPTNLTKKERSRIAKMKKINPDYVVGTQFDMFFNSEREGYVGEYTFRNPEVEVGEVGKQCEFRFSLTNDQDTKSPTTAARP